MQIEETRSQISKFEGGGGVDSAETYNKVSVPHKVSSKNFDKWLIVIISKNIDQGAFKSELIQ